MKIKSLIVACSCIMLYAEAQVVVVHLLDHTEKKEAKSRFWIDWNKSCRGIVSSKTVNGQQAEKLIGLLRSSLLNEEASHFCGHDPIYGIEATENSGKVLKTSLCFRCTTWVKPGKRLRIDGEPGSENILCKALREVIELPQDLLDEEKKQIAEHEEKKRSQP